MAAQRRLVVVNEDSLKGRKESGRVFNTNKSSVKQVSPALERAGVCSAFSA
jgi:hypothetical protein